MKTTLRLFVAGALLLIVSLMSCNPSHPTPGTPSSYKVKQIITTGSYSIGSDTTTITYDALGRITAIAPQVNGGYEATYSFFGDSVYIDAFNNGGNDTWGVLNANGFLSRTVDSGRFRCICTSDHFSIDYHYDNNGFITLMTISRFNEAPYNIYFQWNDSCLTTVTMDSGASTIPNTYKVVNTYFPNGTEYRDNGLGEIWNYISEEHSGLGQFFVFGHVCGRPSKKLIKNCTVTGNLWGHDASRTLDYSYSFDQYGRVATQTTISGIGTTVQQFVYY